MSLTNAEETDTIFVMLLALKKVKIHMYVMYYIYTKNKFRLKNWRGNALLRNCFLVLSFNEPGISRQYIANE